jgi:hypothetical protein
MSVLVILASIFVTTPKLVVTSPRMLFRFPIKELGNDGNGLIIYTCHPRGFLSGIQ